ncbi:hypothetical protein GUJ93_ZPchr0012g18795 [Zizania palustris]|uniref:Uncharacterized protein n=1 Tax=Zizania palustris TaxID=103762 RepID=A0A8J6BWA1_ZIZPA|nr:hypothetical protein GUJ93_ZPchr0006g42487 [Zizania palustris]KAG8095366.1 hypothetical protein GUJ93_ZPchr0012g18795 [Zizania palustris]
MADQQRYVLCSSAHLMQPGRGPFRPDDALQPDTVYFLLPQSIFKSESSTVDLACLMNRLTALASKGGAASTAGPNPIDTLFSGRHHAPTQSSKPEQHDQPTPSSGQATAPATRGQLRGSQASTASTSPSAAPPQEAPPATAARPEQFSMGLEREELVAELKVRLLVPMYWEMLQ